MTDLTPMTESADRYDYLGRLHRTRMEERMRERREVALRAASKVRVQITRDGTTVDELLFDTPPTLADLIARAGSDAFVLAIGRARPDRLHMGGAAVDRGEP